jgi:hypothetical protein
MLRYRSLTCDRLWEILEDATAFTSLIPVARRIKPDEKGWLKETMMRGVSDFTKVEIGIGDSFDVTPFRIETFDQEPMNFDPVSDDFDIVSTAEFKLRFIYRDLKQATDDTRDNLEMIVLTSFIEQGPTLGLSYVQNWRWRPVRWGKAVYVSAAGKEYPITEVTMPVSYLIDGQELMPDPES